MAIIPGVDNDYNLRPESYQRPMPYGRGDEEMPLEQPMSPGIDYLGIAWRRKWVLILFAIIGSIIAYFIYLQTPTTYQSGLKLMINTQSPPVTVNGDVMRQQVSLPKHESLLVSDIVLSNAIRLGKLEELDTLKESDSPMGFLKQNVKVVSEGDGTDALIVTCTGGYANDLPVILNQIVKAYEDIIAQDSVDVGKDAVLVMQSLQQKLETEKEQAENRYFELFKKLGLTQSNMTEQIFNPYGEKITSLSQKLEEDTNEQEEVMNRLKSLADFSKQEKPSDVSLKLLAVDARRYLQLASPDVRQDLEQGESFTNLPLDMQRTYSRLARQVDDLEVRMQSRELDKARFGRNYGARHFLMQSIDSDLVSMRAQQAELRTELTDLTTEAEQMLGTNEEKAAPRSLTELSKESEQEAIRLYAMAITRDRDRLNESIATTRQRLADAEQNAASISADLTELNILKSQIDDKRQSTRDVLDRLAEMNVLAGNYTYTKVRVTTPPGNGYPVAPNLLTYLGMGIVLSSMIGFGLAFLIDWSDQSFRNPQEISTALRSPVIGKVPNIREAKKSRARGATLTTLHRSNSVASEAFRAIRTATVFAANRSDAKVFLLTSPSPGDGKSTVSANLAVSLAQMGKRVILVDGDFRRPRVHQLFDTDMAPGAMNFIDGEIPIEDAIRPLESLPALSLMTVGKYPKNPGELVSSARFEDILLKLRREFDFVLIDSPPVLPVADACGMAGFADGVLMVLRIRRGVIVSAQKAKDQLDMVNAHLFGIIVNGIDNNPYYSEYGRYGYRHGYGYGYGNNGKYGRYYDREGSKYHDRINEESNA